MRRTEIATLTWFHVDLERRFVHLPETKNGEARSVPLSPAALDILKRIPRNLKGSVFALSPENITRAMVRACKQAGIADLRFHDLRHEATSRFFENTDLDLMEIKAITGHKSMQMLARYSHLRAHRLAERLAGRQRGVSCGGGWRNGLLGPGSICIAIIFWGA
ncbi:MAG: site-specific integrase [Desulfovibrionaceae bacterium]